MPPHVREGIQHYADTADGKNKYEGSKDAGQPLHSEKHGDGRRQKPWKHSQAAAGDQGKGETDPNMSRLDIVTLHDSFLYHEEYNKK
jgi:hypothetical protein